MENHEGQLESRTIVKSGTDQLEGRVHALAWNLSAPNLLAASI